MARNAWILALLLAAVAAGQTTSPTTSPTTGPATAPAERVVQWHETYDPAATEARRRGAPLLVVYFDPAAPACEAFEEMTLSRPATRRFLADVAACRLNVTDAGKKKRFAATGAEATPLTQVLTPEGELLDSIPGCIIPASAFRERLEHSLDYLRAAASEPFDAAARWAAVRARLALSTRAEAVEDIDALAKMPREELPEGVTPARLHLARGEALAAKPKAAAKELAKVLEMAPKDAAVGGRALLGLARLDARAGRLREAVEKYARYATEFPDGPHVGAACLRKAKLQYTLGEAPAAVKTLEALLREHPDDPAVVDARRLLEDLRKLSSPAKKKPAKTRPAGVKAKVKISVEGRGGVQ